LIDLDHKTSEQWQRDKETQKVSDGTQKVRRADIGAPTALTVRFALPIDHRGNFLSKIQNAVSNQTIESAHENVRVISLTIHQHEKQKQGSSDSLDEYSPTRKTKARTTTTTTTLRQQQQPQLWCSASCAPTRKRWPCP